ncbi:LLM class flavin-dependent oxidoreductase [Glycomyces harbinensis]|uniref:Flavin-dependent oxidoreductase, luciferase family (Includes alkanesulfonate monooxygenase SsuD and methylene tetrahydromethanopterin reductase) n=1 Tax=Glycomyces harbinensis TaxID=58114 RepID=A0A1G6R7V6_9ACTN|nr:LLM class flavin-dependent oxidoreductase [Glycomyces harbinensis]SDC99966.1 Flavin-dependent oxidoreductase, luciferase family (includes alkanesulfonate monooxygenase SsuD and methylene tetrahydromethanopterin reductase) [Glycomyces harbinensis]
MSTFVQLAFAVGDRAAGALSLADAGAAAALADRAGVAAIRLRDRTAAGPALEPTVAAAYLAGAHRIAFVPELSTSGNAPYNAARRLLSIDRATGGRLGVALLPGAGDEVTDAGEPPANDPAERWGEYADVLTRLWESFPRTALRGDQDAGIVADDARIRPIGHDGPYYRVAGPLDGPSSVQGRPVIVADLDGLGFDAAATHADAVVVDRDRTPGADAALADALRATGLPRSETALIGRVAVGDLADPAGLAAELRAWAEADRLDGFELVAAGDLEAVSAVSRELVPLLIDPAPALATTLRAVFGLRQAVAP